MNEILERLSQSPFINNLGPGERSLGRFLAALAAGVATLLFASVAVIVLTLVLFILVGGWPEPTTKAAASQLMTRFVRLTSAEKPDFATALQLIALAIPSNVIPIFAFVGVALAIHGRNWRVFLTAARRFRWRLVAGGIVMSAILIGPFVLIAQLSDPKAPPPPLLSISPDLGLRGVYALVCAVAFFPAALGEEALFRGWFLRQTSAATHNAVALMLANGAVFAAAHLQFELDAFLERWIMGAGFTYMTLRLGGIELSTGAHFANNLMIVLFLEPLTLKAAPDAGLTPSSFLPYAGLFIAYVAMAEIIVRWAPLRRWSLADETLTPPPDAVPAGPWS